MKKTYLILVVLFLLSLLLTSCSKHQDLEHMMLRLVVVKENSTSFGSAVVYGEDDTYYYALTNAHVIENAVKVESIDFEKNVYDTLILKEDSTVDLAIIQIEKNIELDLVSFAEVYDIDDSIISVGFPNSIYKVSKGEILDIGFIDYDIKTKVITHSSFIDSGSSGGVLLDEELKLIGLNFAVKNESSQFIESYAIPLETIKQFI